MDPKKIRIVFMGTPALAAYSLKALHENKYNIVGVVTAPDKPAGRGLKLAYSEVKKYALENELLILQPQKLKDPDFFYQLKALKPDLQVVVAFRMLPENVWSLPGLGTFNMHASLLPQYRGAAPINWAIINGEKETGVTTFLLDKEIDTGKILFQQTMPLSENETAGSLHDKIMVAGAEMVLKTVDALAKGTASQIDQTEQIKKNTLLKKAPKIFKEDCVISWEMPCKEIASRIHGLSPIPGAYTEIIYDGRPLALKIYEAKAETINHNYKTGELITDGKNTLFFAAKDGLVEVQSLQMAGKKRMNTPDFLRGFRVELAKSLPE